MRVLQVHNRYRQPGGEDTVLEAEAQLLRSHGHVVDQLLEKNEAEPTGVGAKLRLACDTVWSAHGAAAMRAAIDKFRPDVVHVHNTFHKLSPAVLRAAVDRGVPVVQTLHNFRLMCANGLLLREGRPCELCVDGGRMNALRHRCYRGSMPASALVSLTGALHLRAGTYHARGVRLVALTEFSRALFLKAGLSPEHLRVKPNFVYPIEHGPSREQRVVFVGRLAEEKGVDLLLKAWQLAAPPGWVLELIGDGELRPPPERLDRSVRCLGWLPKDDVLARVASSRYLVMASRWYEGLPMVLLEAFSAGTPAIVPRLGAMAEVVEPGCNGLVFEPGSVAALADVFRSALGGEHPTGDSAWSSLSEGALTTYRDRYSPERNYEVLMGIYREAMEEVAA